MKFLLDTNIISELLKPNPNPLVIRWINRYEQVDLFISVLTLGEIRKGIDKLVYSKRKLNLAIWFENDVLRKFESNILNIDLAISLRWGYIKAVNEMNGIKLPVIDSLIACTAIEHNLILATRNTKDFFNTGCNLFNPWE